MPPPTPNKKLAIVTCMDARVDPLALMDAGLGDAHVIRNAGGLVTDDVLRSLETSRKTGTEDVVVIGHTDCGLGPGEEDRVREALAKLRESPAGAGRISGYVFDVENGELREVV
jgi:carbonic anhydrase